MDWNALIDKYYSDNEPLRQLLLVHSRLVADKALAIARAHPELGADLQFLEEGAMIHDIGIFLTDAAPIHCFGTHPYICHGYLGADLMRSEGFPRHALVCERHTGTGLGLKEILEQDLPVPHRDMVPVSIEEILVCFADKFFSKTRPTEEKSIQKVELSLQRFGPGCVNQFRAWCERFL